MPLTIYHNPRCSKSRQTLAILEEADVEYSTVEYLKSPPDAKTIESLAKILGIGVSGLVRRGESVFRDATDLPPLDDDAALAAWVSRNPATLQRPIVFDLAAGKAVIGRPPEAVNTVLES